MFDFDGDDKIITVSGGASFSMITLYREAREWEDDEANMQYVSPLDAVGKNELEPDVNTDIVYILSNGWKLQPSGYSAGETIAVEGTVITDDNTAPTVPASVGSPVTWVFKVAYSGIITNISTGSGLSSAEHDRLMSLPTEAGSGGLTVEQAALLTNIDSTVDTIDDNVKDTKAIVEDNQALLLSN